MKRGSPSNTMVFSAIARAMHQVLDDEPKLVEDPLAIGRVEGSSREEIIRQPQDLRPPEWVRSIFPLRSRFTEDSLREAVADGVRQYVMLGAGLDTFPYRQPTWALRLQIFEIDHPDSQKLKLECLSRRGISVPANAEFCPIDFENTSLAEGIARSSLNRHARTFFSWLGVTQYLSREAIDSTLRFLLSMPKGSQLAMTFIVPPHASVATEASYLDGWLARVAERGEAWLTFFTPEEIVTHLLTLGFSQVSHLAPADAAARYFSNRRDGLKPPQYVQLLRAIV